MYGKILFAVGDDAASDAAVPVVSAYAGSLKAEVHVLHVHRVGRQEPNGKIRRMLRAVIERLEACGVNPSGEVRLSQNDGDVPAVIARVAAGAQADLVALGSRGRSDLGGLFLGSVSHKVLHLAHCPVILVR